MALADLIRDLVRAWLKIYNCDLSAAANIAARYWAYKLKLTRRKDGQLPRGKRSSDPASPKGVYPRRIWGQGNALRYL